MNSFITNTKDDWKWTSLIMQPDFISVVIVEDAMRQFEKKKNPAALSKLRFEPLKVGLSAQILHIGPYSEQGPNIEKLHNFIKDNEYELTGKHQEIYLGDPRKALPENLRTIIRQPIEK